MPYVPPHLRGRSTTAPSPSPSSSSSATPSARPKTTLAPTTMAAASRKPAPSFAHDDFPSLGSGSAKAAVGLKGYAALSRSWAEQQREEAEERERMARERMTAERLERERLEKERVLFRVSVDPTKLLYRSSEPALGQYDLGGEEPVVLSEPESESEPELDE